MYLVKANTVVQVQVPKSQTGWYDWRGWMPHETKEDQLYDSHEFWDAVAVQNGREGIPDWARRNILEFNKVVLFRRNKHGVVKYALVGASQVEYVD